MLPNLSGLDPRGPAKRPRSSLADRLRPLLAVIDEADNRQPLQETVDVHSTLGDLTDDEISTIRNAVVAKGNKPIVVWFLRTYPQAVAEDDIPRNATREWWQSRFAFPEFPALTFQREVDGFVTIDLWHTRRGTKGPDSFKDFKASSPTFFLGSRGIVDDSLSDLEGYVGDAQQWEPPEEHFMYVKRGRFRINPLLWFDDKNVANLRKNTQKAEVVAALVNSHESFKGTGFDLNSQPDKVWKKSLYYRTEMILVHKLANELRLDNNCVEPSAIPLAAGYHGTLAVDVSGPGGAMMPPGSVDFETESVVLWDVPGTLLAEGPWEKL